MKWIFYTFWIWYAIIISIELLCMPFSLFHAKILLYNYYSNFGFPCVAMGILFYTDDLKPNKNYALGIGFSMFLRTIFWIAETEGFDNKKYLLMLSFFIISVYLIFEIKIRDIEKKLL